MRGVGDRGVMWFWQTLCAATLAGSVQHALERGDRLRLEAAARLLNPAESCAAAAQSMERAIAPTVRLANASAQKGRRMAPRRPSPAHTSAASRLPPWRAGAPPGGTEPRVTAATEAPAARADVPLN